MHIGRKYKRHEYIDNLLVVEEIKNKLYSIYKEDGALIAQEKSWEEAINCASDCAGDYACNDGYSNLLDEEF